MMVPQAEQQAHAFDVQLVRDLPLDQQRLDNLLQITALYHFLQVMAQVVGLAY